MKKKAQEMGLSNNISGGQLATLKGTHNHEGLADKRCLLGRRSSSVGGSLQWVNPEHEN